MRAFATVVAAALAFVGVSACAVNEGRWVKSGASEADFQRDAYECERDTRAVSYSFGRGILIPVVQAQEFASRCMVAKGWGMSYGEAAATSAPTPTPQRDASGRQLGDGERILCTFPGSANPHLAKVELTARACAVGGGTIVGPAPPQAASSDRQYDDREMIFCNFVESKNPTFAKIEVSARTCRQGGGVILGPAT